MNSAKLLALPRRLMVPIIVDNDSLWSGCSDDAAFFARYKKRIFRFRNAFPGEWSEFGEEYRSVLVIRLPSWGFRLRIGLPIKRLYDSHFEASSDYHASEQLAEQCEEVESRLMDLLIFDNDGLWPGCSDDAAFFARYKTDSIRRVKP